MKGIWRCDAPRIERHWTVAHSLQSEMGASTLCIPRWRRGPGWLWIWLMRGVLQGALRVEPAGRRARARRLASMNTSMNVGAPYSTPAADPPPSLLATAAAAASTTAAAAASAAAATAAAAVEYGDP